MESDIFEPFYLKSYCEKTEDKALVRFSDYYLNIPPLGP
jgi:hypothetical protein